MSCTVREMAGLGVVRQVIRLHDAAWGRSPGILDLLRNSTRALVLVSPNGQVQGYAFLEEDRVRGFVELQDIVVDERHRNGGLGRQLMLAVQQSHPAIKLMARASRTELVAFYRSLGFEVEQSVENYYDIGEDSLRMCWRASDQAPSPA
jgi:ribosomal protein S18 acetylase RimI-like enzyme